MMGLELSEHALHQIMRLQAHNIAKNIEQNIPPRLQSLTCILMLNLFKTGGTLSKSTTFRVSSFES